MMTFNSAAGRENKAKVVHVIQGSQHVSNDEDVVITTILGSCVATCLWDEEVGVGGMNHFLLANEPSKGESGYRHGLHAMELLINELLKFGARRTKLKAKIFGGAMMQDSFARIGKANGEFAKHFLNEESIPIVSESLGGSQARRIRFFPKTGFAQQKLVAQFDLDEKPKVQDCQTDVTFF